MRRDEAAATAWMLLTRWSPYRVRLYRRVDGTYSVRVMWERGEATRDVPVIPLEQDYVAPEQPTPSAESEAWPTSG